MVVIINHYFLIHEGATPLHRSEQVMNDVGGVATQESMDRSISSSFNGVETVGNVNRLRDQCIQQMPLLPEKSLYMVEDDKTATASVGKNPSLLV